MAITNILKLTFTILVLNFIPLISSQPFSTRLSKKDVMPCPNFTLLHFFFHDLTTPGPSRTAFPIVAPASNSTGGFGSMVMIDDPLTEGPKVTSKLLGRAQGIYGLAELKGSGLLMVMNYVFTEASGYNGSTLSLMGRNDVASKVREMSIVGGTGAFRFASGYAQAKTYAISKTGDFTVEYHVTVMH